MESDFFTHTEAEFALWDMQVREKDMAHATESARRLASSIAPVRLPTAPVDVARVGRGAGRTVPAADDAAAAGRRARCGRGRELGRRIREEVTEARRRSPRAAVTQCLWTV